MNGHLDTAAICNWVAGERSPEAERHLLECAECAAAVLRFETGLAGFRDTATGWSNRLRPPPPPSLPAAAAVRWRALFATTALAACLAAAVWLVAIPIERSRAAEQARADSLLLEQVDAAVSRSAPEPMEPLLQLVNSTGENQ